jgi:hypothetical protein
MKGDFCVPYMNSMLLPTQLFLEAKEKKRKNKTLGRCLTLFAKVKTTKKNCWGIFFVAHFWELYVSRDHTNNEALFLGKFMAFIGHTYTRQGYCVQIHSRV